MQIKPADAATAPSSTSSVTLRPVDVAQVTSRPPPAPAPDNDSVSLSNAVQNLASALREALPTVEAARIAELLTPRDRLVLVRALEIARADKLDAKEVRHLIVDLTRYRAAEGRPQGEGTALRRQDTARVENSRLALPTFSARDESIARSLLSSLALRDTVVDHGFVRALVDPDRNPTHAVDFSFLRRVVLALSPNHAGGALDPSVSLERRVARTSLAAALNALALDRSQLPEPSAQQLAEGRTTLRERLRELLPEASPRRDTRLGSALRADDRALLSVLYVAAKLQKLDPARVDDVVRSLIALRASERVDASAIQRVLIPTSRPPSAAASQPPTIPTLLPRPLTIRPDVVESGEQALASRTEPPAQGTTEDAAELASRSRSFGSSSQFAARVAGGYRSMIPPPAATPTNATLAAELSPVPLAGLMTAQPVASLPMNAAQLALASALARPLDVSQALGMSIMVDRARVQLRRLLRMRLRHEPDAVRPVTRARAAGPETEAEDPVLAGSQRGARRRARWQLVILSRKRRRKRDA